MSNLPTHQQQMDTCAACVQGFGGFTTHPRSYSNCDRNPAIRAIRAASVGRYLLCYMPRPERLFCADRAPNTDQPREKRLRACASQQTVAAAAESSRGTKNSRKRSAKEAAAAEEEDGGFTLESRGLVRAAGEAVAVGDDRTCLPDALWICLTACGKQIKLSAVRKSMVHRDENSDPTYAMAKSTALQYGMQLAHISRLKASPAGLFNYDCGMFLVRLRIECATGTDYHYVAYNAQTGRIFDNERYAKVPRVEATDKRNNKSATKVFFQLFPKAKEIWVDAVSVAQINSTY